MRNNIGVAVLGATGAVGQRMVSMLDRHPWFEVRALCASDRSAGKRYDEACRWTLDSPMPLWAKSMTVSPCDPGAPDARGCAVALSALDASVAGDVEIAFARAGVAVVSNARNHRMSADVPLVIPEVNHGHLAAIGFQRLFRGWPGLIVTNPNCSTIGLAIALKPLHDAFGVKKALVSTMQAISGAGYPGVPALDITENVIPHIGGEEEKIEQETRKILGRAAADGLLIPDNGIVVSAHCNRVPVRDGHTECVSVELERPATAEQVIAAWDGFECPLWIDLPTLPASCVEYTDEPDRPQPRRDRDNGDGMTVSVGRLRPCPVLGWKFVLLSHNTIRGAAGGSISIAELLVRDGVVK